MTSRDAAMLNRREPTRSVSCCWTLNGKTRLSIQYCDFCFVLLPVPLNAVLRKREGLSVFILTQDAGSRGVRQHLGHFRQALHRFSDNYRVWTASCCRNCEATVLACTVAEYIVAVINRCQIIFVTSTNNEGRDLESGRETSSIVSSVYCFRVLQNIFNQ